MSDERQLWRYLQEGMRGRWHAQRHEDRISSGIPDVSYAVGGADGWLELKFLTAWPRRPGTLVDVGLTPVQALWLDRRGRFGGERCFVLLRAGREHLLFHRRVALLLTVPVARDQLYALACARWERRIDFDELERILS